MAARSLDVALTVHVKEEKAFLMRMQLLALQKTGLKYNV